MFLEYERDFFVNREEEIKIIDEMVRSLNRGVPVRERAIFVFGPMGIGKTWLLKHLCYFRLRDEAFALYEDLARLMQEAKEEPVVTLIEELSARIAEWRGKPPTGGEKPSLDELSRWLKADAEDLLNENPRKSFVLCLDSIDQVEWEFLGKVEDFIMAPLLGLPRFLLLIGGRRYIYPWRSPEIRFSYRTLYLGKFSLDKSRKQIEKLKEKKRDWSEIEQIDWLKEALGYPWLNYLAATEENPDEIPGKAINIAFAKLPPELLPAVEQLSVLRYFDETRIQLLLNDYSGKPFREVREFRENLVAMGLARWDERGRGYALDSGLRTLLEIELKRRAPDKWKRLHCKAYGFYSEWAKHPEYGKIWEEEAKYHSEKCRGGQNE